MGATLDSIFAVNISLANAAVQQKGFGRGLVLGASNRMSGDLFRLYTSLAGMVSDGFQITDPEYLAARAYFSQTVAPRDVLVGYAPLDPIAQVDVVTVATVTDNFGYTVTVNGQTATYTSDNDATAAEIVAGLISAINALPGAAAWTADDIADVTDRFTITSDVAGTAIAVTVGTVKLTQGQFNLLTVAVVTDGYHYSVTINDLVATFVAPTSATATDIQTGLVSAINSLTGSGVTAAAVSTNKISLVADVVTVPFLLDYTPTKLTAEGTTLNAAGGVANGLDAIIAAGGKDWYGLILTSSRVKSDIEAAAAWIEAQPYGYIFLACSDDSDVLTNVTTDVLSEMKALSYLRTGYIWSDDQDAFPEAAWLGEEFPKQPGSSNYAWKSLVGIAATDNSVLTDSKISILEGKNGNYYLTVGINPVTQKGKMVGGQWIDVVVGRDWIKANIQQELFALLINSPKIGFDDPGIGALANVLRGVLQKAVDFNIILPGFVINVPLASSFSATVKQSRILPSIPWSAELVGAINGGTITGTLTA